MAEALGTGYARVHQPAKVSLVIGDSRLVALECLLECKASSEVAPPWAIALASLRAMKKDSLLGQKHRKSLTRELSARGKDETSTTEEVVGEDTKIIIY